MNETAVCDHTAHYDIIAHDTTRTGELQTIYWCQECGAYCVRQIYKDDDGEHNLVSRWIKPKKFNREQR